MRTWCSMVVFVDEICNGQFPTNIDRHSAIFIFHVVKNLYEVVGLSPFCHLGESNSLTETPITAYANGQIQKPHAIQSGREAGANKGYLHTLSCLIFVQFILQLESHNSLTVHNLEKARIICLHKGNSLQQSRTHLSGSGL